MDANWAGSSRPPTQGHTTRSGYGDRATAVNSMASQGRNSRKVGNVNPTKALLFLVAFTVIGVLTVIEGVNDGFTLLNWVVVAVSVVFAGQAVWTLTHDRSSHA